MFDWLAAGGVIAAAAYLFFAAGIVLMFLTGKADGSIASDMRLREMAMIAGSWPWVVLLRSFEKPLTRLARRFGWREQIIDAFDPSCITRRYEVHTSGYASGKYKTFWSWRQASRYYEEVKLSAPTVTLEDSWLSGEWRGPLVLSRHDNREKFSVPPIGVGRLPGYCYDAPELRA